MVRTKKSSKTTKQDEDDVENASSDEEITDEEVAREENETTSSDRTETNIDLAAEERIFEQATKFTELETVTEEANSEDVDEEMTQSEEKKSRKRQGSHAINIPGTSEQSSSRSSGGLPPWVAGGSPAKFISHDEILKISTEMENMELVHEIAIDPNYKIPDVPANPIEMCVKENMQNAYFNLLRKDLAKDPPEYEYCLMCLMEIKNAILEDILTPKHVRIRGEIDNMLNEERFRESIRLGNFDYQPTMKYVLDLCGRLCAPERDEIIVQLRKKTDFIELLQGVHALLDLMKNDITNYNISQNRVSIEEYSAKHEYDTFQQFLALNPNGCDLTRKWLSNAFDEIYGNPTDDDNSGSAPKKDRKNDIEASDEILVETTSKAYVTLVQNEIPDPFPETMKLDKLRIRALAEKFSQIIMCASAVLVTCNVAGREISESDGFKRTLKDHLIAISNNIDDEELKSDLDKMAQQCVKEAKEAAERLNVEWTDEKSLLVANQISALLAEKQPIRSLVYNRVTTFIVEMLRSPTSVPHRLLPGLSIVQSELCAFTARFLRLCVHNRKTFYELYQSLILEFQADKSGVPLDRSFCREASPSEPSTSGISAASLSEPGPSTAR